MTTTQQQTAGDSQGRRYTGQRTPPRLPVVFDQYELPLYFVTFCTAQRQPLLAGPATHERFRVFAERGKEHSVSVGRYVIILNPAVELLCVGRDRRARRWFKDQYGLRRARRSRPTIHPAGEASHPLQVVGSAGQRLFSPLSTATYRMMPDHIHLFVAGGRDFDWGPWVRQNPVRAGLVARAEDWPSYQGEIVWLEYR